MILAQACRRATQFPGQLQKHLSKRLGWDKPGIPP